MKSNRILCYIGVTVISVIFLSIVFMLVLHEDIKDMCYTQAEELIVVDKYTSTSTSFNHSHYLVVDYDSTLRTVPVYGYEYRRVNVGEKSIFTCYYSNDNKLYTIEYGIK